MTLDAKQAKKMLLVALTSDQPGEVMAAITKLKAALKTAGLDVHWLADSVLPTAPVSTPAFAPSWRQQPVPVVPWQDMLGYCDKRLDQLSPREHEFILSLMIQWGGRERWHPTEKQLSWLTKIYTRVRQ